MKKSFFFLGILLSLFCSVEGQTLFSEDFTTSTIPNGWEVTANNPNDGEWIFTNPKNRDFYGSTANNGFAIIDSDWLGSGKTQNTDLISPNIDVSGSSALLMSFEHYYKSYSNSTASFWYSTDNGTNWIMHTEWSANTENPEKVEFDFIDLFQGANTVKFKWHYEGSYAYYWCVDNIRVFTPTNMIISAVEISDKGKDYVIKGQQNAVMALLNIETEGEINAIDSVRIIGSLANTTQLTDVQSISIYSGNNENDITPANLIAQNNITETTYFADLRTTFHTGANSFVVCYSISESALADNLIDISVISANEQNSSANTVNPNPDGEKIVKTAMSGTYTINQDSNISADFNSIDDAIEALNELGVMNTVIFELADGTYDGFIELKEIFGTTADKRVIFSGNNSNADLVKLTSNAGYVKKPTLNLNAADFISFENLTVTTSSSNFSTLVHLKEGACNNYFTNVKFIGANVTAPTYNDDKHLVYSPSSDNLDSGSHFTNCRFENGYIALNLRGININEPYETDLQVIGCFFTNQYSKSIYTNFIEHSLIKKNTFENSNDRKSGFQSIDFYRAGKDVIIEQNFVNIQFDGKSATGIELRPATGTADFPVVVKNNMIRISTNASYSYPIICTDDETNFVNILHNTCIMEGASAGSACLLLEDEIININVENNIFFNDASGYVLRVKNQAVAGMQSNYNLFSVSGDKFAKLGSNEILSLGDWVANAGKDENSRSQLFNFVGEDDFHITDNQNLKVNNPLNLVTYDFDGSLRSLIEPWAGADELLTDQAPVIANQVDDVVLTLFPEEVILDLSNSFDDPDNDNTLISLSVLSNSNSSDIQAEIQGNELTISRLNANQAVAEIVVRANSNGLFVDMTINVNALAIDLPPVIANQVEDVVFTLFPEEIILDLSNSFDDPDNDNTLISLSVLSNSNSSDIQAEIQGNELTISRLNANQAVAEIVVRANSNGLFVDMTINVNALAIDLPPVIANQVEDVVFTLFPEEIILDLSNSFDDPDNDNTLISLSVLSNSNSSDIQAEIQGNELTISRLNANQAVAEIVVRANSNGLFIDMTINVNALAIDLPPVIANQVEDVILTLFPEEMIIDLSNSFDDPDNDNTLISLSVLSNSNSSDIQAEIQGNELTISRLNANQAEAEIVVRANSNGLFADMTINVNASIFTSIDDENSNIRFYPNPTKNIIHLEVSNLLNEEYVIFDGNGNVVKTGVLKTEIINVSDFKSGIYILRLQTKGQTIRFIKN
jgi:hypothetical protein